MLHSFSLSIKCSSRNEKSIICVHLSTIRTNFPRHLFVTRKSAAFIVPRISPRRNVADIQEYHNGTPFASPFFIIHLRMYRRIAARREKKDSNARCEQERERKSCISRAIYERSASAHPKVAKNSQEQSLHHGSQHTGAFRIVGCGRYGAVRILRGLSRK